MAERGVPLVYGGGRVGLMGTVANASMNAGGEVIGVIPQQLVDVEAAHHGVTELVVTSSMHERKAKMAELSHGCIALPGGYGTFEEVFEILTWNQLGLVAMPVVFLDVDSDGDSFWSGLAAFLDTAAQTELLRPQYRGLARFVSSVDEAIDLAIGAPPAIEPKWAQLEVADDARN